MKLEEVRKSCFFCGQEIEKNKTLEHIIPNSLLKKLGIKEDILGGKLKIQYSRVKVPAHQHCNNNFGSQYEKLILEMLDDPERIYNAVINDDGSLRYGPEFSDVAILRTWMTKIYYGLFYNDYLKTSDEEYRNLCKHIISSKDFNLTRESYSNLYGFNLPSSLYVFKTKDKSFDLLSIITPSSLMLRINGLILVLCIADGFLCKQYLRGETLADLSHLLEENENNNIDFPSPQVALSEIMALRVNIPKSPSFIFNNKELINLSLNTLVKDPQTHYQVDIDQIEIDRNDFLLSFGIKLENLS